MIRLHRSITVVFSVLIAASCTSEPLTIHPEVDETYGFEAGLAGWTAVIPPTGGLVIVQNSGEMASAGSGALQFLLNDDSGNAAAMVTRAFSVEPDRGYDVEVSFDLATADGPAVQPWTLRFGAGGTEPASAGSVAAAGSTGSDDDALEFEERTLNATGTAGPDGTLWVTVGVSQETGGSRTYFVDELRVSLTRR